MSKSELSSRVAADASLSKAGAGRVIDAVLSTITVGAQDLEPAQMVKVELKESRCRCKQPTRPDPATSSSRL